MTVAFALAAMACAAALAGGCGQADDASFAKKVAANFGKNCQGAEQQAEAPNEPTRQHLNRICACAEAKIAGTPMRPEEGDDAINRKVHGAMGACLQEVGGAPGEGTNNRRK
jgi:hypothetical protein